MSADAALQPMVKRGLQSINSHEFGDQGPYFPREILEAIIEARLSAECQQAIYEAFSKTLDQDKVHDYPWIYDIYVLTLDEVMPKIVTYYEPYIDQILAFGAASQVTRASAARTVFGHQKEAKNCLKEMETPCYWVTMTLRKEFGEWVGSDRPHIPGRSRHDFSAHYNSLIQKQFEIYHLYTIIKASSMLFTKALELLGSESFVKRLDMVAEMLDPEIYAEEVRHSLTDIRCFDHYINES